MINKEPPFEVDEIDRIIATGRNNRAPGPDGICNEHLKLAAPILTETWTALLNKCLEEGEIPEEWRKSKLKLLYKGKGNTNNPDSYRGIALESAGLKVLTRAIANRVIRRIEPLLPEEQFGFRPKRSTLMAVSNLLQEIQNAITEKQMKLYVLFIDYQKAFDSVNRQLLVTKLEDMLGRSTLTRLIGNIMAENYIQISDSVGESNWISQKNGVLQGDPMSPILFNILTHDVGLAIKANTKASIYIYADDMALASENVEDLQKATDILGKWAAENEMKINEDKTDLVVFKRGGRITERERIMCNGKIVNRKSTFKYLGVTIQTTGTTFAVHLKEKQIAAIRSINSIGNLSDMSMSSAMKLFEAKIWPTCTYGLEMIWEYLSEKQMRDLESIKSRYLKRALGLSKYSLSRYAYELARETFFLEDLRLRMLLPATESYKKVVEERRQKRKEITEDFYSTNAMIQRDWTNAGYDTRWLTTGLATHGYHHRVCATKRYHSASEMCICELCGAQCGRYHILECRQRVKSIRETIQEIV